MGRYGERWGEMGRYGEIWGDARRRRLVYHLREEQQVQPIVALVGAHLQAGK